MNSGESDTKDDDKRTPYERFRDLAQKVVRVPKDAVVIPKPQKRAKTAPRRIP